MKSWDGSKRSMYCLRSIRMPTQNNLFAEARRKLMVPPIRVPAAGGAGAGIVVLSGGGRSRRVRSGRSHQRTMKRFTNRINKRLRCLRNKCAKEWTIRTRKQRDFNKGVMKKCNKKPCDDLDVCVANNPNLKTINDFETFAIEMDKVCPMVKQCGKYYSCSPKIAKQTGYQKAALNLMECGDKMCAN